MAGELVDENVLEHRRGAKFGRELLLQIGSLPPEVLGQKLLGRQPVRHSVSRRPTARHAFFLEAGRLRNAVGQTLIVLYCSDDCNCSDNPTSKKPSGRVPGADGH